MSALVDIRNLRMTIKGEKETVPLLKGVSFSVSQGKIVSLVGGSGSGKTSLGLSLLQLLPPALSITGGEALFEGKNLLSLSAREIRDIRGKKIAMVFQEPMEAFNPLMTVEAQIEEVLQFHTSLSPQQRPAKVLELLKQVKIPDPKRVAKSYPHQLSGGLRQRAMIAQAIAAEPKLIIADEPTSNLDVTLQAQIMELFRNLKSQLGISILLITHDLGLVEHMADEAIVLHQGEIVERGPAAQLLKNPQHAFTRQLRDALMIY